MRTIFFKISLVAVALVAVVAGCASTMSAADLLLSPADLPNLGFEGGQAQVSQSNRGGQAAQTTLRRAGVQVFHSVVVFGSSAEAKQAMDNVGTGAFGQARPDEASPGLGDESVVVEESQGTGGRISVLFRKGRVLERLSVAGALTRDEAIGYARAAEKKV